MIKLVDITYYSHLDLHSTEQIRLRHRLSTRYSEFLSSHFSITFIMHAGFEACEEHAGHSYRFFRGINKFGFLPFKSSRFIARQKADVVLVQGLGFPIQLMLLKLFNPRVKILVQHHCERPFTGIKLLFQQLAACFVSGWLFTAEDNALPWKQKRVIDSEDHLFEVLEASTEMRPLDYSASRSRLGMELQDEIFLWVGRLVPNKDPLLVLNAFRRYITVNPLAKLYLIYQTDDLLPQIKATVNQHPELARAVHLVGKVPHHQLAVWYSAADFYISASNREGSGYALIEAMACGCMPVVSAIPPFRKITGNGGFGLLYETGDAEALLLALFSLKQTRLSRQIMIDHFKRNLSFRQIAVDISKAIQQVCPYKAITLSAISSAEKSNTGS